MAKKQLLTRTAIRKLLGWERQKFYYYEFNNRIPGKEIINCVPFFDKEVVLSWKPKDRRAENGNKNLPRTKRKYED